MAGYGKAEIFFIVSLLALFLASPDSLALQMETSENPLDKGSIIQGPDRKKLWKMRR